MTECCYCGELILPTSPGHEQHEPDCQQEALGWCRCQGLFAHDRCCPECHPPRPPVERPGPLPVASTRGLPKKAHA